jgi:hypothetical protein
MVVVVPLTTSVNDDDELMLPVLGSVTVVRPAELRVVVEVPT